MSEIVDILIKNNEKMEKISKRLDLINKMFANDKNITKIKPNTEGFVYDSSIEIINVYEEKDINIVYGIYHKKNIEYPLHSHNKSLEVLFVTKGSFSIDILGETKILKLGNSIVVPMGICHLITPLEDESIMFAACIPPEIAYSKEKEH